MKIKPNELVIKISVSNIPKSRGFYEHVLRFTIDDKYTINADGNYGPQSYMQLNFKSDGIIPYAIGLYKDIDRPYDPLPQTGTVPSFIVEDIEVTLKAFESQNVTIDKNDDGSIINTNKSDKGYVDKFFFFRDPDNNSLVIRQNFGIQP